MTRHAVKAKWRPRLSFIVFTVLTTVMALPLVGLVFFRLYENQLVRQTEMELITQSAVLAAVLEREVRERLDDGLSLGRDKPRELRVTENAPIEPVLPLLDLAVHDVLDRRPDGQQPQQVPEKAYLEIGERMSQIVSRTRRVTLAGFRILDPRGTVIGGRGEVGLSLAHVDEVASALGGYYTSVLRVRVSDLPRPPIYSVSRGTDIRVFAAMPVFVENKIAGVIYTSRTPSNILKHLYEERRKVVLAAITVLGVTLLTGLVFVRVITRPINGLMQYVQKVGSGDRENARPPKHHGSREIAMLSQSFIDMTQQLADRSDYIQNFAAHVSHELKTPLTSIQGAAELLRDSGSSMTDEERRKFLGNVIQDTGRLTALLERLRDLARADNPQERGPVSLDAVLSDVQGAYPRFHIEVAGDAARQVPMSRENAVIIFTHLVDNSIQHGAAHLGVHVSAGAGRATISIRDDGEGISEYNRDKIFDPFFTTRRETGGTGMGLGIVRSMLQSHGGDIQIGAPDRGAAFELSLPVV